MSTTRKHTPGPWTFHAKLSASENHRGFTISSGTRWIGDVNPMNDSDGNYTEEALANARLFVAAPDLYEALRYAVNLFYAAKDPESFAHLFQDNFLANCEAAIAKAEGRA